VSGLHAAAERFSLWITPALLLSLPVELLIRGSEGLWAALLVVVAPLFGFLVIPTRSGAPARPGSAHALVLIAAVLVWANLLLAGDVARWLGYPRAVGIVAVAAAAVVLTAFDAGRGWGLALAPAALLALFVPLGAVVAGAGRLPLGAWSHVASAPAFRFSATSPWVTEGRAITLRPGTDTLLFEDEHRVTSVDAGALRILVGDAGHARVQEWKLAVDQSVTLRPGDRLMVEPGQRLRFEADKRVPGAPVSGASWADPPRQSFGPGLVALAAFALTVVGGATALLTGPGGDPVSRTSAALAGGGYLLVLVWAESWATYTLALAPDLFLGGVTPEKLLELPALVFAGDLRGRVLGAVLLLGGFVAFLASITALRGLLARDRASGDWRLWSAIVGATVLASVWPQDPWKVLLLGFGLGASTLAPAAWIGIPPERSRAAGVALGGGLFVFLILVATGQLWQLRGAWAEAVLNYPALLAMPVNAGGLWLVRRLAS